MRSTGSGMGCPDWPKCFGAWIPPTDVSQLPPDYLRVYQTKRIAKNEKLASYLNKLGFTQLSVQIFSQPSQYLETEFNASKTWIEYLNRLVGALIGVFIFLTVLFSYSYFKKDRPIFYLALFSLVLVGFQGWLGSVVVSTNLLPVVVMVHMALALLLVAVLIYAVARSQRSSFLAFEVTPPRILFLTLYGVLALSFGQILLGTQVRELIDTIANALNYTARETWIGKLGAPFYLHRSFSLVILLLNVYLCRQLYALRDPQLQKMANGLLAFIGLEILVGVGLSYFALPAFLQPVHLLVATLIFGLQFFILITCYYATRNRVLQLAVN